MTTRLWVLAFACLTCATSVVMAAPKSGKPATKGEIAQLAITLDGIDDEAAAKAAIALGESTDPAAHEALLDALALGLRASVAYDALGALAKHPAPPDVASLQRYASHHNVKVRGVALATLALYPDPAAHKLVVQGLHDPIGAVREAAANAAAKGHVRIAIEPLFELLARGEEPAARALAAMADADLVRKLGDHLGKVPDASLALCMGLVLRRPEFGPDSERVEVVRAIAKIQDQAAVNALTDYIDATPKNPPRASRSEAEKIVEARLAGGGK
ncbi:MAG: HEAT repeat domain-containing protein [Kofleriaceae bacterium]